MKTPMRAAKRQVEKMRKLIQIHKAAWEAQRHDLMRRENESIWVTWRHLDQYLAGFEPFISKINLLEFLKNKSTTQKRPVRILDDGAGEGNALRDLKHAANSINIPTHTTALSFKTKTDLETAKRYGWLDEIVEGHSEFFIPKKGYDLIFSIKGSTTYTLPQLRKEHWLKLAHCLNKGGLMLAKFEISLGDTHPTLISLSKRTRPEYSTTALIAKDPKTVKTVQGAINIIERDLNGIKRAFEKRGFEAKWIFNQEGPQTTDSILGYKGISMLIKRIR